MRPSIIVEKYRCQKLFQGIRSIFPPPEPFSLLNCESCPGENAYFRKMKLYFLIYLEENHLIYCSNWDCIRWGLWKLHSFYLQSYWRYFTLSDKTNLIFFSKTKGYCFLCSKDSLSLQKRWKQVGTKLRHHTDLMTPSLAKKFTWLMLILYIWMWWHPTNCKVNVGI